MKRVICSFSALLFIALLATGCGDSSEDSAEQILNAVASGDAKKFDWLTTDEAAKLTGSDAEAIGRLKAFAANVEDSVRPLLVQWKKQGSEVGINWEDVSIDTVSDIYGNSSSGYGLESGCMQQSGFIYITSGGKKFKIRFSALMTGMFGRWLMVDLTRFSLLNDKGLAVSNIPLRQEGTFDEFYHSLAKCFEAEAEAEIDKIFLTDAKGKRVFFGAGSGDANVWDGTWNNYIYEDLRKRLLSTVNGGDYGAEEMNAALLSDLPANYALDQYDVMEKSELYRVGYNLANPDPSMHFLGGWFMRYKGKWYYIGGSPYKEEQ